eukprot:TRINITY_DN973_c0_g1_i2.p1 TRINITY_DN973_c0_g1~~TRINITY_DN973_c0_g1_i2.p1  ORF type:complete len:955 (+),score=319.11 TRINITY_DN973_c0_g1_i2:111-2975(+)
MAEKPCTLLIHYDKGEPPNMGELKKQLEAGGIPEKIEALKTVILLMLNGELLPQLLMTMIRFVMPIDDHQIKKLLLIYWEIVDKQTPEGKPMPEMILVCNALRNDVIHPNEYVRGSTLRFLTKLKEPEILEPLLPSVRANLEYKHAYVRRNAVLGLYNIYKNFDYLCPDAPELVYNFLLNEGDASCKRNAFIMLFNCAQEKAVQYLGEVLDQISGMGEILQIIVVELIRKVCRTTPSERPKYIKCIFTLLNSNSPAVQYEAAGTLISLSAAPTAVRAAASTFIDLLVKESDNNVKMIVLDRLLTIKAHHSKILQELLMDILRALASPNMDIRQKTLDIALDLVSPKNIDEVILVLKKEIQKTQSKELDKATEYRQMLIQAIHSCAVKFPDIAANVVDLLMDFLGDSAGGSAMDVMLFVREVVEKYPELRRPVARKLLDSLTQIKSSKVFRTALWIIGEYSETREDIDVAFTKLRESIGDLPFFVDEEPEEESKKDEKKPEVKPTSTNSRLVLPDGTYASQSAMVETSTGKDKVEKGPQLRVLLLGGDFFLGAVLSATLTKLVLKLFNSSDLDQPTKNAMVAEVLLTMVSIVRLGQSKVPPNPIDPDSFERIAMCIRVLTEPSPLTRDILLKQCRDSFSNLLLESKLMKPAEPANKKKEVGVQADEVIKMRQLRPKKNMGLEDLEDIEDADLSKATGAAESHDEVLPLNRVYQLTGFSDPIYAEAYIYVHQYDIVLDVVVINQTNETLQNVCLELSTLGDLKLVERPQNYTIGPQDKKQIKANIKVSSTETGIIFGNIVYDIAGVSASDKNCVILNDIHIDIMDYIAPAYCTELKFRSMWIEFEWENKVAVNTNITDVNDFLKHIVKSTNMQCLTPESALGGECGFLSANLYARSVFGEDALANVSIEKQPDGKIGGFIRIRSKTQGIALSLGDKINLKQREVTVNSNVPPQAAV